MPDFKEGSWPSRMVPKSPADDPADNSADETAAAEEPASDRPGITVQLVGSDDPLLASRPLGEVPLLAAGPTSWLEASLQVAPASQQASSRSERLRSTDVPSWTSVHSSSDLDWKLVRELKTRSAARVEQREDRERSRSASDSRFTREDRQESARDIVPDLVDEQIRRDTREGVRAWPPSMKERYVQAVMDSQFGYGRLHPLFQIEDAEDITINGYDSVVCRYSDGRRETLPPIADSDEELIQQLQVIAGNASPPRKFDAVNWELTVTLEDTFRLHAVLDEMSARPTVDIRRHHFKLVSLADLSDMGMMPIETAEFMDRAVKAGLSIVVSGDQSAGKTTLLRALIDAIPIEERIVTVETDPELFLHLQPDRRNNPAFFARIGMGEIDEHGRRIGDVAVSDLIPAALRQAAQRIVVGEVRGNEASAMIEAMQFGVGSLSSTHSKEITSTPSRLAARIAQGGVYTLTDAYRQIAMNIDLLIHVKLVDQRAQGGDRRRLVTSIRRIMGMSDGGGGEPAFSDIYDVAVAAGERGSRLKNLSGLDVELARYAQPLTRHLEPWTLR